MFLRRFAGLLCAIILVVGCESRSDSGEDIAFEASIATTDKFGQHSTSFVQGEEIVIILSVKNISPETKTLHFSSGKKYDFVIKNSEGIEVWRWSDNMLFTQAFTSYDLASGEERTFTYKWNQTITEDGSLLPVGSYTLEGVDFGVALTPKQELKII